MLLSVAFQQSAVVSACIAADHHSRTPTSAIYSNLRTVTRPHILTLISTQSISHSTLRLRHLLDSFDSAFLFPSHVSPLPITPLSLALSLLTVTMPASDYVVLRQLGKGSFGRVFLVKEVHDDTLWVMKEIDLTASGDPAKARADALKEVGMLSRLDHPNIVKYKECFTSAIMITPPPPPPAAGAPPTAAAAAPVSPAPVSSVPANENIMYIIMEYADAGDLNIRIRAQRKPFSEQQILNWFVQLCLAIKHLHDRKCLHRDIKAENIFLTSDNRIKLGDFGISKLLPSTFACAITRIGTPYYLSPEICMNRPYNTASDMWSLGVCLYEMCMLSHPFDASSMEGLLKKIVRVPHRPVHSYYREELRQLCDELMQKNPSKRPSIAAVLRVPCIHREISKWLTKKQIEQEFLFAGMSSSAAVVNSGSVVAGELLSPSSAPVSDLSPNAMSLASPSQSPASTGNSIVDEISPRRAQQPAQHQPAVSPRPQVTPLPASVGAGEVAKPSLSRPASVKKDKKSDDTWQWLKDAEDKMRAAEEQRRSKQQQPAVAPLPSTRQPATKQTAAQQQPTNRLQAAVDKWAADNREEKQQHISPAATPTQPPTSADLAPVPTIQPLFSPRTKPVSSHIPTLSQPASPTGSSRSLHHQQQQQSSQQSLPPSPTHRRGESSGSAFRVERSGVVGRSGAAVVAAGSGAGVGPVSHRRGVSGVSAIPASPSMKREQPIMRAARV